MNIRIGSTIKAKRSTKWLATGVFYRIIGRQMAFPYFIVRCPFTGAKHYIHKNNIKGAA